MKDSRKVAIVTGGARGLGRAMTLGLSKAEIDVAALDLPASDRELGEVVAQARHSGGGIVQPIHADVTQLGACAAAVEAVLEQFGRIDILVNNAGINDAGFHMAKAISGSGVPKFYELEEEYWRRLIETNLNGAFRMAKLAAPHLVARGWGRIVNVTTSFSTMVSSGFSPYGPSKAALEAATSIWAKELAGTGVTVNVLLPGGAADTRLVPVEMAKDRSKLVAPEKMVPPLLWIVSSAADKVTGQRYIANLWDAGAPLDKAVAAAGAPAAWQ